MDAPSEVHEGNGGFCAGGSPTGSLAQVKRQTYVDRIRDLPRLVCGGAIRTSEKIETEAAWCHKWKSGMSRIMADHCHWRMPMNGEDTVWVALAHMNNTDANGQRHRRVMSALADRPTRNSAVRRMCTCSTHRRRRCSPRQMSTELTTTPPIGRATF